MLLFCAAGLAEETGVSAETVFLRIRENVTAQVYADPQGGQAAAALESGRFCVLIDETSDIWLHVLYLNDQKKGETGYIHADDAEPVNQWTMPLYLILLLGVRRGEAVALLDTDVDMEPDGFGGYVGTVHVHRAFKESSRKVEEPKTPAGVRRLPMPAHLCDKVAEWRETRAALGYAHAEYLCCNSRGLLMHAQNLNRWWRLHRNAYGCADMGLHQLRHSNLSMMARRMSPFDLKDWAGWSSIAPAKIYVHRDMDAMRAAVNDVWGMLCAPNLHH